ncbi:MAG TPA: YeeE/YedE family protein [Pseudomonadales bacterium]
MTLDVLRSQVDGALRRSVNRPVVVAATAASVLLAILLGASYGWRQATLFAVGLGAGLVLYHAAFGFTGAWRVMITERRSAGLRAQMVMMSVAVMLFMPLLAAGELNGTPLRGSVAPLSSAIVAGAFLFGVGMQLGGGCASGTLFTVGGGNVRMIVTLLAFIAGSVLGAWHWPAWQDAPQLAPVSLLEAFGPAGAIGISVGLFGLVWYGAGALERRRHGRIASSDQDPGLRRWLQGPWPLIAGALGLAAVNVATLTLAGRPWGVTSGFALWGSKAAAAVGLDVAAWPYWQRSGPATSLQASVFSDITSVMNFGIVLGALAAAGLAGRFAPAWRMPLRSLAAAIVGGLLLGYGARIAYGCNIGAYFSGLASASLHGWLWFAAAFAGNSLGVRLRPVFALDR